MMMKSTWIIVAALFAQSAVLSAPSGDVKDPTSHYGNHSGEHPEQQPGFNQDPSSKYPGGYYGHEEHSGSSDGEGHSEADGKYPYKSSHDSRPYHSGEPNVNPYPPYTGGSESYPPQNGGSYPSHQNCGSYPPYTGGHKNPSDEFGPGGENWDGIEPPHGTISGGKGRLGHTPTGKPCKVHKHHSSSNGNKETGYQGEKEEKHEKHEICIADTDSEHDDQSFGDEHPDDPSFKKSADEFKHEAKSKVKENHPN